MSIKRRSLLNGQDGFVTCIFMAQAPMDRAGYVFGYLRRRMDESEVNQVSRMRLTHDSKGAVFDVPEALVDTFLEKCAADIYALAVSMRGFGCKQSSCVRLSLARGAWSCDTPP